MKKTYLEKGFTLIELLVVIAIIGILSSVVLASLNTARGKGSNAATKSNLANARAQAELYNETTSSYTGVCTNSTTGIGALLSGALSSSGASGGIVTTAATAGTGTTVICHDTSTAWAAAAPMKTPDTGYWCVDSTGTSAARAAVVAANSYVCPTPT